MSKLGLISEIPFSEGYTGVLSKNSLIYYRYCNVKGLVATSWAVAHQAPLSMQFLQARILEWVAFPGDLPDPGIEPWSPGLQADSLLSEQPGKP